MEINKYFPTLFAFLLLPAILSGQVTNLEAASKKWIYVVEYDKNCDFESEAFVDVDTFLMNYKDIFTSLWEYTEQRDQIFLVYLPKGLAGTTPGSDSVVATLGSCVREGMTLSDLKLNCQYKSRYSKFKYFVVLLETMVLSGDAETSWYEKRIESYGSFNVDSEKLKIYFIVKVNKVYFLNLHKRYGLKILKGQD